MTAVTRYIRYLGFGDDLRPFKAPLAVADPLAAYAPFAYASEERALVACALDLSRRWAEVADGARAAEDACLNHYVVRCLVHADGRIEGGDLVLSFPAHWGGPDPMASTDWEIGMTRREIEARTARMPADG